MNYKDQVKKYLEYCEYRKELDWNTLKAYRIDLRQFFEFAQEDVPEKSKIEGYICYTMVTVFCSTVSLWIGFYRKSGIVTIVAACIIVVFICQIITMTFYSDMLLFVLLLVLIMLSFIAIKSMQDRVEKMEV